MVCGSGASVDNRVRAEMFRDPAHAKEILGRDLELARAPLDLRVDLELVAHLATIVEFDVGRDGRVKIRQRGWGNAVARRTLPDDPARSRRIREGSRRRQAASPGRSGG